MNRKITLRALSLAAAGLLAVSAGFAQVNFNEVTASAGVQVAISPEPAVPFAGGAAWADFNNDGWDDLFVVQADGCNHLFRNQGDGTFAEVADAAGASDCAGAGKGVAVADWDNDGDEDLYVTNYGQNRMYRNTFVPSGSTSFVDVTVAAGFAGDGEANSASASFGDYDNDGWLDLVVVNHALYVPFDENACKADLLYHNNGNGTFTEVGGPTGVALSGRTGLPGCGLATTWSDYDNDGDVDLWVVNDFGEVNVQNKLFRNDGPDGEGGWLFTDEGRWAMVDYPMFGMGIAIGDIDRDGDFDYYMSDIGPNNMALNNGKGEFSEIAASAGTVASDRGAWGASGLVSWGNAFIDLNGDGWDDLLVANGGASEVIWPGMFGPDYIDFNPIYAYGNKRNGTFREAHNAIGLDATAYFRNIAISDYDNDGDQDLHLGVLEGNNQLYRNDSVLASNWLKVKAVGTQSNRDAIGAKVIVRQGSDRQIREVSGGSGFLIRHSLTQHFYTGTGGTVDEVIVRFPSGQMVTLNNVTVNQIIEVVEPAP